MIAQHDLAIHLLGRPAIYHNGVEVTAFISDKVRALFYYLVITRMPHRRAHLAALCWDNGEEADALRNLRRAIHNLRELFAPHLRADRQVVAFVPSPTTAVTVDLWQTELDGTGERAQQISALAAHCNLLLNNFDVDGAPGFEEWLVHKRHSLVQKGIASAEGLLARPDLTTQEERTVLHYLTTKEPWHEIRQRRLMMLHAYHGKHDRALAIYLKLEQHLSHTLSLAPEPDTSSLAKRIARAAQRLQSLPTDDTILEGTTLEDTVASRPYQQLTQQLTQALRPLAEISVHHGLRLFTVRTTDMPRAERLVRALAIRQRYSFLEGIWWINSFSHGTVEQMALAVAQALGVPIAEPGKAVDTLISTIHDWNALLILPSGTIPPDTTFCTFMLTLLANTRHLRLIILSKTPLHVKQELLITL